ncbi:MAG: metallophosphoesterase [Clostridia bacterium]|nr:metallophosphoesterase [Clostridia bacterium]
MSKIKRIKGWQVAVAIVLLIAIIALLIAIANIIAFNSLLNYINTFDSVDYSGTERVIPVMDKETGYYTFTTDKDFKVMVLTDIHLGGGSWNAKKDKKAVYEVMTMLQNEKPDFVILDGDNVFAVPGPIYNGGGTLNNKMASKGVLEMFEKAGVYFSVVFGNHDTEVFDYTPRDKLGELYMSSEYKYCIFNQDFTDSDHKMPSITNQFIVVRNGEGKISKLLMLMDSNAYVDNSLAAVLNWDYDTIHDAQVLWAKDVIETLSKKEGLNDGEYLKTLAFFHIPIGEYETAYRELYANNFEDTENSKYLYGVWGEEPSEEEETDPNKEHGRIWYGGITKDCLPEDADILFETLGPDGINSIEGCFVGHDHVNNAVVNYKGVNLSYGYSVDNIAYTDIHLSGTQRGCTVITISPDGKWTQEHKNAYKDLGVDKDKFVNVYLDRYYYENTVPKIK